MSTKTSATTLPTARQWYRTRAINDHLSRVDEPHVHGFLQANIWHLQGSERDLVVDAGLGVASLRRHLPALFANDPILVVTHAHLDHAGSAHEFEDRRMHPSELGRGAVKASLYSEELVKMLGFESADEDGDVPPLPELLVDALPDEDYRPQDYTVPDVVVTTPLEHGDTIDLGDRELRVLHLPGHTPGSLCLYEDATGVLFSGDVIYDDLLLDELVESDIDSYVTSMRALRELSPSIVYPGHGDPFGNERMHQIVDNYLHSRARR